MWVSVAMMAVQFIGALFSNSAEKEAAKAQRIVDEANANAKNTIRAGNNEFNAAKSSLANYVTSLNNQNNMKAAGEQFNALGDNMVRALDQSTTGTIQERLKSAEQAGAMMAAASSAGLGGSSINMINGSMALRRAQIEEIQTREQDYAVSDQTKKANSIMGNALRQMDYGIAFANIDYGNDTAPYRADPSLGSALLGAASRSLPAMNNIANTLSRDKSFLEGVPGFSSTTTPIVKGNDPNASASFLGGISSALGAVSNFFKPTSSGSNYRL